MYIHIHHFFISCFPSFFSALEYLCVLLLLIFVLVSYFILLILIIHYSSLFFHPYSFFHHLSFVFHLILFLSILLLVLLLINLFSCSHLIIINLVDLYPPQHLNSLLSFINSCWHLDSYPVALHPPQNNKRSDLALVKA
jgi:hypothetical protein